MFHLILFSLLF